jgi:hypothetical protein
LQDRLPDKDRLRDLLGRGPQTTRAIAEYLGKTTNAARMYLRRHPGVIQVTSGGGMGNNSLWGLRGVDPEDDLPWD